MTILQSDLKFKPGDPSVFCDRCGCIRYKSECRHENWHKRDLIVCEDCFDPFYGSKEHQGEWIASLPPDQMTVEDPRPVRIGDLAPAGLREQRP